MAGQAIHYHLYPLTFGEYLNQKNIENNNKNFIYNKILKQDQSQTIKLYDIQQQLKNVLLYGQYPQTIGRIENKLYLKNLVNKAIFKDIIELNLIDDRAKALDLLKLLSYQIGNLVSYSEIANKLQISTPTVQKYIEIFEQSYILYRLYPFSKNLRKEISKAPKIYFWDLGLRNALINNFDNIDFRPDSGAMFENFIITEVKKEIDYLDLDYEIKYWRLKSGSEVDVILHNHKELVGCEVKLNKGKVSRAFRNKYPEAKIHVVSGDCFL